MSDRPAGLARRADQPGTLALNAEDDLARNAAVVQAAGYHLIPLADSIGPWLSTVSGLWGHPASFPIKTRRLIHCWKADAALPEVQSQ